MRRIRFRLRTLMIIIAFLALSLTVIIQSVLLHRAAVREQQYRAELAQQRAMADGQRDIAVAEAVLTRALFERMSQPRQQKNGGVMKEE